jgi:hypothetical protein
MHLILLDAMVRDYIMQLSLGRIRPDVHTTKSRISVSQAI